MRDPLLASIIIPVLNEKNLINPCLERVSRVFESIPHEVILCCPQENERAFFELPPLSGARWVSAARGRATQMNAGAACAKGDVLLFLHVDTQLPEEAPQVLLDFLKRLDVVGGAFDLEIDSRRLLLRFLARLASWRSRLTRVPYGDQALFFKRAYFFQVGGFPQLPFLEDLEMMRRLKRQGKRITISRHCARTSARRWEREGLWERTGRNLMIRALYGFGISAHTLKKWYSDAQPEHMILLFTKFPTPGTVKTRLAKRLGPERAAKLYRAFVSDLLKELDGEPLWDVLICFSPAEESNRMAKWLGHHRAYLAQKGQDLGYRMLDAFETAKKRGYQKILVLGTDAPDLSRDVLKQAFHVLTDKESVLGPASDGGYYLLAFQAEAIFKEAFEGITWSTDSVYAETLRRFEKKGQSPHVLPLWHDIDTWEDLLAFALRHQGKEAGVLQSLDYARELVGADALAEFSKED